MGHITLLRGHSDTGKTTLLLEAAVNAQKAGYYQYSSLLR
jgi:RecA/RadA recombinase